MANQNSSESIWRSLCMYTCCTSTSLIDFLLSPKLKSLTIPFHPVKKEFLVEDFILLFCCISIHVPLCMLLESIVHFDQSYCKWQWLQWKFLVNLIPWWKKKWAEKCSVWVQEKNKQNMQKTVQNWKRSWDGIQTLCYDGDAQIENNIIWEVNLSKSDSY